MFTKLIRITRDAEMKYLQSGTAVLEIGGVYDIGFGENKQPQWLKLAMFGQRAEKLAQHFTKGTQIVATMDDVKAESWISNGEAKSTISAKLVDFEFAGGNPQGQQSQQGGYQQQPAQHAAPQMAPAYQQAQRPPQPTPQHRPQQAPAQRAQYDENLPPF